MKTRILTVVLAFTLLLLMAIPAVAAPITTSGGTGTAELSYSVASTFSVNIPVAVTVTNGATTSGTEIGTGTVTVADGMFLAYNKELNVKISGANFDEDGEDGYRLQDGTNDNYLKYAIVAGETPVTENEAKILTVAAGTTAGGSKALTYTLAEAVTIAGTYTDTLTFTVSIDDQIKK